MYTPQDVISTYSGTGAAGSGLDPYLSKRPGMFTDFFKNQKQDIGGYLDRYTGAIKSQEPFMHMYDRFSKELGLPQLRESANSINTTLANIPSTYSGATRGFDVNANQLERTIGQKYSELAPTAQAVNSRLSSGEGFLKDLLGYETSQQEKELKPFDYEKDLLNDYLSREATGFTRQDEGELDSLIEKMRQGVALSTGEQTRANQLAIAEKEYQAKMAEISSREKIAKGDQDIQRQSNLISLAKMFG